MAKRKWKIAGISVLLLIPGIYLLRNTRPMAMLQLTGLVHGWSVESDFSRFPANLPGAGARLVSVHRGLPHPSQQRSEFVKELWTSKNVDIYGYRFYRDAETLSAEFQAELLSVLSREETFEAYGGPKLCGGYHPDFVAVVEDKGVRHEFLVCLGCHEVLRYAGGKELMCDLEDAAVKKIREIWDGVPSK